MTSINKVINENRSRYRSFKEMYEHAKTVSDLTNGNSGFFGVSFSKLLPALKQRVKKLRMNKLCLQEQFEISYQDSHGECCPDDLYDTFFAAWLEGKGYEFELTEFGPENITKEA